MGPRKYRDPCSFGIRLDRSELQDLRKIAVKQGRPVGDLLRGATLCVLAGQGLYDPNEPDAPNDHDNVLYRLALRLLDGQEV